MLGSGKHPHRFLQVGGRSGAKTGAGVLCTASNAAQPIAQSIHIQTSHQKQRVDTI